MSTPESGPVAVTHSSRAVRRTVTLGSLAMVVMGLVLLYMLMQATNNREQIGRAHV